MQWAPQEAFRCGGFVLLAAYSGGIQSIQKISVAKAQLLFATAPFFAALLGRLFLGEKISLVTWSAIGAALAGVFVMVSDSLALPRWAAALPPWDQR